MKMDGSVDYMEQGVMGWEREREWDRAPPPSSHLFHPRLDGLKTIFPYLSRHEIYSLKLALQSESLH